MGDKVKEVLAVFMAIFWACVGYEDGTSSGEAKKKDVVNTIVKEIEDEDGFYIPPGKWRDAVVWAVPFGVNMVVRLLNNYGVFKKSS